MPERSAPQVKVTEYLLNTSHEEGSSKAAFFSKFGFSRDSWMSLAKALHAHAEHNAVDEIIPSRWGTKYVVRCGVESPDGRNPSILSVWNVRPGQTDAVLVTAYPANNAAEGSGGQS
jgi:hypothetical protein